MEANLFIFNFKMFFKKLFVLFLLLVFLDIVIGNILSFYYFRQKSGLQYRTTFSIDSTKAEVIIFGSSRANHHYNPDVFENELKMSYYNAGRDGNYMFYHYAVLKCILKRYTPKIIILDFLHREFNNDKECYDRLSLLLPYYKNHPEIRPIVNLQGGYIKLKKLSSIYPYNSSLLTILIGNLEFNKKRKADIKGYIPLFGTWKKPLAIQESEVEIYAIDSIKINAFKSFIQACKNSNIRLYVICSPYFYKQKFPDYSVRIAKEIALNENVLFWDFSQDSTFLNHPSYFLDLGHLNNDGAVLFSKIITDKINNSQR
jgi:hypothetical protein